MPTRSFTEKHATDYSILSSSLRLDSKSNGLTEEHVDELSLIIENESTHKMENEMRKLEIIMLKASKSLSES